MLISYGDKKKKGTTVVLAPSTMHNEMRISKYDIDIVDLLSTMLSTPSKTK